MALATDFVNKDEVALFPNPVKNEINFKGISKVSEYEIFSADGKLIKSGTYKPSVSINVAGMTKGVYFIKINGKNLKFVKD